jgi:HK97 family phage major capsid protein/HK97 family phage prohead protease
MKKIKSGTSLQRSFAVDRAAVNEEARTVELAFSSEEPYDRWWGREILDHTQTSIRLNRLTKGGPLLMDHDSRDHVGVIESVQIGADRVGRAVVRFGKSARAEEVFQDVKDGIRTNVSVGYVIHDAVLTEKSDDIDTYRVTDWEPFEVSMVAVPADASVGVGRSADSEKEPNPIIEIKETKMDPKDTPVINVAEHEKRGADNALKTVNDIIAIGQQYKCEDLASEAIRSQKTVDQFKTIVMEKMANKPLDTADLGLSKKEVQRFSFMRAINALANDKDRKAFEAAAFERELSDAIAGKLGKSAQGFYVPNDVQKRDLTVGTTTAGGFTVDTILESGSFIDILRNSMMVMKMGAQMLTGLTGSIAIPRQTGAATAYWVAESGAPTESQQAFDQVSMAPKTVGAYTDISRKLLLQSSIDVESFVQRDLAQVLALAIDLAAITGSGASNQPTGILNTSGIGDVAGGTNGLAPTWANIIELWSDVAIANAAFGNTGYLTNAKVAGKLMTTEKATGTAQFVCPGFPDANGLTNFGGARAGISNQVPSNLVKGTSGAVASAILFGNWADLIIGQWGTLDLMVDPYSNSTSGTVRVVALQDVDIAIRHAESFSAMKDALTA